MFSKNEEKNLHMLKKAYKTVIKMCKLFNTKKILCYIKRTKYIPGKNMSK